MAPKQTMPARTKYELWPDELQGIGYGKGQFEKIAKANNERLYRTGSLARAKNLPAATIKQARKLSKRIGSSTQSCASLACPVYFRGLRIAEVRQMWLLCDQAADEVSFVTVIPKDWEIPDDQLHSVDPRELLNRLRAVLYRCGAADAPGWIRFVIHGEHDPTTGTYQFHVHGLATEGMIKVVDALRKLPNFRSCRRAWEKGKRHVYQRVRRTRKALTDLPDPLTYIVQSFWPRRCSYSNGHGDRARQTKKRRLLEPHHTLMLLWLDRWTLEDLTLSIGLRQTKSGLKPTRQNRTDQKGKYHAF